MIKVQVIHASNLVTKSKLPDADYVCNPYTGCIHKCIYCYAEFMKRFTNHSEEWGDFLDIKDTKEMKIPKLKEGSTILISSVTDAYNPYEKKYELTRKILSNLVDTTANVEILTKSSLVTRDIDIIKKIKNTKVGLSINTLDDNFRRKTEPYASSIEKRIEALKILKKEKVHNYAFVAPIFPGITNVKELIDELKDHVDFFWFENLNLRAAYKKRVLDFIREYRNDLMPLYEEIYCHNNISYWENLRKEIEEYCEKKNLNYKIYFYHDKIKKR